ncbi:putative ribosomal large subunit pseudouridine synthase A [Klebsiella pneumoniae]|uniref:Putative ribosomal large subunit pseudouridine synthase A n=1 Tax=Klebsiella pneumoniae TaxID=573 RepID=A0A378G394_KLEPN|nr:putative ribosomal large subunit pseudouridine synthase A [Klebsiella pneumoniae]
MRQHRAGGQNEVLSPATPSSGRLMSTIIDTFVAPPCREQITLLYQDEHLVLINKPAGLLSLSGKDPRNLDSVHHRLVQRFPGCTLVHRLDFGHLRPDGDRPHKALTPCCASSSASARWTRSIRRCCAASGGR